MHCFLEKLCSFTTEISLVILLSVSLRSLLKPFCGCGIYAAVFFKTRTEPDQLEVDEMLVDPEVAAFACGMSCMLLLLLLQIKHAVSLHV